MKIGDMGLVFNKKFSESRERRVVRKFVYSSVVWRLYIEERVIGFCLRVDKLEVIYR